MSNHPAEPRPDSTEQRLFAVKTMFQVWAMPESQKISVQALTSAFFIQARLKIGSTNIIGFQNIQQLLMRIKFIFEYIQEHLTKEDLSTAKTIQRTNDNYLDLVSIYKAMLKAPVDQFYNYYKDGAGKEKPEGYTLSSFFTQIPDPDVCIAILTDIVMSTAHPSIPRPSTES